VLAGLEHHQHLRPDVDVVVHELLTELRDRRLAQRSSHRLELASRHLDVPLVAARHLDVDQARALERLAIRAGRRHPEVEPLGSEVLLHRRRGLVVMADQPVGRGEPTAGRQHARHLASQRVLVGHVHDGVLREHDVERCRRQRQRPGRHLGHTDPRRQAVTIDPAPRCDQHRVLDVDPRHPPRAEALDEGDVDAADAAPDVQHGLPGEVDAGQHTRHLVEPAWREEAVAPHQLEHPDEVVVVELTAARVAPGLAIIHVRPPFRPTPIVGEASREPRTVRRAPSGADPRPGATAAPAPTR
jgi:hypothetical protein